MKLPIYLDNHATTPVDPRVLEVMLPYFTEQFGNAASYQHEFGWHAEQAVALARRRIAGLIGAEPEEIVFTSGATESNNLALKGALDAYRGKGDHIVTASTEHPSVLSTSHSLERRGIRVTVVPVDGAGNVDPDVVRRAITGKTVIVSVMAANNEIGTLAPLEEIGRLCSERNILFHTDATQLVGKLAFSVREVDAHIASFSSHKMYGPKGVGALYVRGRSPKVRLEPIIDGGGHERGLRSGTLNVPAIVGFGKAAELAAQLMADEAIRLRMLRDRLERKLATAGGTSVHGGKERLPHNLSIAFNGIRADDLMGRLKRSVALSAGSACSSADREAGKISYVLTAIGLTESEALATVRIGLGRFTTEGEIDLAGDEIVRAVAAIRVSAPRVERTMQETGVSDGDAAGTHSR